MNIILNGASQEVEEHCSLADLLRSLDVNPLRVAVEVNQSLVPRGQHDAYQLQPNDRLEIVTLVGGG